MPFGHHDPSRHAALKARYGLPESAIVWHGKALGEMMRRLLPMADDARRLWEWEKADPRPRKVQRTRLRYSAEKALAEKGRLSHAVLLLLDEATKMDLRPCLGFSDLIARETGVPTLVWMPRSEFSAAPRMRGGTPTESKAFRRYRHARNREEARRGQEALQRYQEEVDRRERHQEALQQFRVTKGIPLDAIWCRDGRCDRFYLTDATLAPEGEQPCYRCRVNKRQLRYRVSGRHETIPGV